MAQVLGASQALYNMIRRGWQCAIIQSSTTTTKISCCVKIDHSEESKFPKTHFCFGTWNCFNSELLYFRIVPSFTFKDQTPRERNNVSPFTSAQTGRIHTKTATWCRSMLRPQHLRNLSGLWMNSAHPKTAWYPMLLRKGKNYLRRA